MITILNIDDEPALLDIGRLFLERSGEFYVLPATSGKEALDILGSRPVDAVVSDYQMPGMDGIALLKEIRLRYPDLPFILFTGKGREEVVIEAINNGADFYLQKGGDPTAQFVELEHKIRQAIRRKRSEECLIQSEERFRSLIQNASDIITILDENGCITYASPSFHRLLGYLAGSELGRTAIEYIHPADRETVGCELKEMYLRKNTMEPTQHRLLKSGGEFMHAESVGINLMDVPGVNGIVITTRDITERKRMELAISASGKRLQAIIDHLPDATLAVNREGTVIAWNRAMEELSGVPAGEMIGSGDYAYAIPFYGKPRPILIDLIFASGDGIMESYTRVVREGKVLAGETALPRPQGIEKVLWGKATPLYGENEEITGAIESIRDITELRKTEAELKKRNEELSAAYEQLTASEEELRQNFDELVKSQEEVRALAQFPAQNPNPVMRIDAGGMLSYANAASARILSSWGIGKGVAVPNFLQEKIGSVLEESISVQFDATIDGSSYHVTAAPVAGEQMVNIYFLDITDRKRAEDAVERRNEELQAAYRQLSVTDTALRDNYRLLVEKQRTLAENEEKYRNLFEAESDAIFLIDNVTGGIIEANTAASLLYGYSHEELLLKKNSDLSAEPEQTAAVPRETPIDFDQVVTIPRRWHRKRDGTVFPVEITGRFFVWQDRPVHIAAIRDATVRRIAEEVQQQRAGRSVRYQKALVQLATTDAPTLRSSLNRITETGSEILSVERVSIWFMSANAGTLVCNDLFIRGRKAHESGQEISASAFPLYFSALQENRALVAPDVKSHEHTREFSGNYLELHNIRSMLHIPVRSGKDVIGVICFEETGQAREWDIEDQDFAGALADYTAIVLEQARRRLVEKDLVKSEEKYRAVVDRANDGIAIIMGGNYVFLNPKAAAIFGYTPSELLGTPFLDLVAPADRQMVRERYIQRKNGEDVPPVYEISIKNRDNQPVAVELNAGIITFEGKPADLVFIRDISDRKRSEQAIRLANQKLNLLSSVTRHDILNKLTIVIGYLELAKMTHDREKLEDFIRKIDATLQVMEEQIQFTHDYQDMGVKDPEWQDAASVFGRAVSQLDCGSVRIENRLSGLIIFADPLLSKVLYNIVDNALRYGEKVMTITAGFRKVDGGVVLTIEDDGIGISSKDKGRIFEKGFGHHTGLGLFLVKEILSLTGIEIMETGFPGKGAVFELHVPFGKYHISAE